MSETTVVIDGHTYERDRGVWWIVLAKGRVPVMPMALDEVLRLRSVIEEAAAFLVADLCPTGGANTADVMAVVARLRTAVEAQS